MNPEAKGSVRLVVDPAKFIPRRKYLKDIAHEYEVSSITLNRWLKRSGIVLERGYIPGGKQIEIYDKLGWPECFLQISAA